MKFCVVAALVAAILGPPCNAWAADIFIGGMRWTGIPAIWITGPIELGDEQKFADVAATHQASIVYLSSPGGVIGVAIAISRMVRNLKLDTFVGRGGTGCYSACPLIWLAGRHAIVQRNSFLGFHASNMPEGNALAAQYLRELGLSDGAIQYMLSTPNYDIRLATEPDASALGFRWQTVPSLFGAWRSCQAKYCLAVP